MFILLKLMDTKILESLGLTGNEIKIYRASPDFMLVYAKGIVEFRYEETLADKLSKWISIIGLIILILLIVMASRKKFT